MTLKMEIYVYWNNGENGRNPPIMPPESNNGKAEMDQQMQEIQRRRELKDDCAKAISKLDQLNSDPKIKEQYGETLTILIVELSKFNSKYQQEEKRNHKQQNARPGLFRFGITEVEEKSLLKLLTVYKKFIDGDITEGRKDLGVYKKEQREKETQARKHEKELRIIELKNEITRDETQLKETIEKLTKGIAEKKKILRGLENLQHVQK